MVDFKFDTRKNGQLRYMDRYHLDENNLKVNVARKYYFKKVITQSLINSTYYTNGSFELERIKLECKS